METSNEDQRQFQVFVLRNQSCMKTTVFLPLLLTSLLCSPDLPYATHKLYSSHFPPNMIWRVYLTYLIEVPHSSSPLFQHLHTHMSKPLSTSKLNSQKALSVGHYLHDKTISIV